MPDDARKLTDAELDARIQASIARILANVDRQRLHRERERQANDPTTTADRTDRIIPEREGS